MSDNGGPPPEGVDQSEEPVATQAKPSRANDQNAMFLRAARAGQLEQVLEFLRNGIDINTCNSNGLNSLHLASKEGHTEVVRELIRRGAKVDAATRVCLSSSTLSRHYNRPIHSEREHCPSHCLSCWPGHHSDYSGQSESKGTKGTSKVLKLQVENGANTNAQSLNGFTPLYMAAQVSQTYL
jgi:ankyrin